MRQVFKVYDSDISIIFDAIVLKIKRTSYTQKVMDAPPPFSGKQI